MLKEPKSYRRFSISEYIIFVGVFILAGIISLLPDPILLDYQKIIQPGLVLFLGFLMFPIKDKIRYILDRNDLWLWLFILFVSIRLLSVANFNSAFHRYYLFIIPSILLYYIAKVLAIRQKAKLLLYGLCIFGLIVAIIGVLELIFRKNIIYLCLVSNPYYYRYISFTRLISTQFHPAVLGTFMIPCIGASIFLFFDSRRICYKILFLLSSIIFGFIILYTFSRGSLIGMLGLLFVFFGRKRPLVSVITILLIFVIIINFFTFLSIKNSITHRLSWKSIIHNKTWEDKILYSKVGLKMCLDYPFLGAGLDNCRYLFDNYSKYYKTSPDEYIPDEKKIIDNSFVLLLVETGILGFLSFLGFLLLKFKRGLQDIKLKEPPLLKIALVAILFGLLINFNTYDAFYWMSPLYLFWIFMGLIN